MGLTELESGPASTPKKPDHELLQRSKEAGGMANGFKERCRYEFIPGTAVRFRGNTEGGRMT